MKLRDLLESRIKMGFGPNAENMDMPNECPWCGGTPDKPRKRKDAMNMMCAHECHKTGKILKFKKSKEERKLPKEPA